MVTVTGNYQLKKKKQNTPHSLFDSQVHVSDLLEGNY